jgi:hypothetical protein
MCQGEGAAGWDGAGALGGSGPSKLDDRPPKPRAHRWLLRTWAYPASILLVLLLLLPFPPRECSGLGVPGMLRWWVDVSRMLLMRPRLDWKPELLLLRLPRDEMPLAASVPSMSELYEYPCPLPRPVLEVKVMVRESSLANSS